MAISKGLRRTIEKLQEESKRLGKTTEHEMVDGIGIRKDEKLELEDQMKTRGEGSKVKQSDILELREKVHELEKDNESLQHKLKKKEKALERFQSEETDEPIRPRASSATSLGASSGYQSEKTLTNLVWRSFRCLSPRPYRRARNLC
ncbi:hypothetical protein OS493_026281 [Desmophyllum pertusum]|uniref:Uncharacterized protein n=1 Tax=Desmophyllum pertusum TaxID=174260 RepID=A0A9W9ZLT3_9CNID|nr:hypothetical protein OS493_026281 [Desmophyllum pertusum]